MRTCNSSKGKNNFVIGNYLINNTVQIFDNETGTIIKNNEDYRTENRGVASVVNGSFIKHDLAVTPTSVQLTLQRKG